MIDKRLLKAIKTVDNVAITTPKRMILIKFLLTMNRIINGLENPVARLESVKVSDNEAIPVFSSTLIGKKKMPDTFWMIPIELAAIVIKEISVSL